MRPLIVIIAICLAREAAACSCVGPSDVKIGLKCSHAYFLGLVIEGNERTATAAKISVVEGFKGVESGSIVTVDGGVDSSCGKTLVTGGLYLIQAWRRDGTLHTNLCSQTLEARNAGRSLYLLRRWAWWWRLPFHRCR